MWGVARAALRLLCLSTGLLSAGGEQLLHSDYLYLRVAPSSLGEEITGVFATADIPPDTILCEYRGLIVPEGSHNYRDVSFKLTKPDGKKVRLIPDNDDLSVCALINDCVFIQEHYTEDQLNMLKRREVTLPTVSGFSYNARVNIDNLKVFISSTRTIFKDEEIFYPYGSDYWVEAFLQMNIIDTSLSQSVAADKAYELPIPSDSSNILKSDDVILYTDVSSLGQHVGLGVFARTNISKGTVLCEYRGALTDPISSVVNFHSDHAMHIATFDGDHRAIMAIADASSIAMFVNDCVDISGPFSDEDIHKFFRAEKELPLLPGCAYNAEHQAQASKVFVVAIEDISQGEEVFSLYGSKYWAPRLESTSGVS